MTGQQKLVEQLLKTIKISSLLSNRYLVFCTVYFIVQVLPYYNDNKTIVYQLLFSFYQQLDVGFWRQVCKERVEQLDIFVEVLRLFNKSVSYKPLEMKDSEEVSYLQIKFLAINFDCQALSVNDYPVVLETVSTQI